jgi:hypothetical protein
MQRTSRRRPGPRLGLLALLLLTVFSCGKAGPFVSLRVAGLPPETAKLRVSATFRGLPQTREIEIPAGQAGQEVPVTFDFPADAFDTLSVAAEATDGACVLARKDVKVTLDDNRFYDAGTVQLDPQPLAMCSFTTFQLTVNVNPPEGGSVVSDVPGIDCGSSCKANFRPNAQVTLTARTVRGYRFTGWLPTTCASAQDPMRCTLTMDQAKTVAASYALCQGMWCSEGPTNNTAAMRAVWGTALNNIFAVGDAGTLLHYDGTDWRSEPNPADPASGSPQSLRGVGGPKTGTPLTTVTGDTGTIMTSTGVWGKAASGTAEAFNAAGGQTATSLYAVGNKGQVRRRKTDGTWNTPNLGAFSAGYPTVDLFAIMPIPGGNNRSLLVGASGFCTFVDMAGLLSDQMQFSNQNCQAGTKALYGAWFGTSLGFIVGERGFIGSYNGSTFAAVAGSPAQTTLRAVWGGADTLVYAVGDGGTILKYDGTWKLDTSPTTQDLYGVWGLSNGHFFAVGAGGTILHYWP